MKEILDRLEHKTIQRHNKETFYFSFSKLLERASYYGLRALAVMYMTSEILKMESNEALNIYGWIALFLILSQIIGAFLGDLLLGNRTLVIIGGFIQAIGSFCLCIPSLFGLYFGIFLVVLGSGFYSSNLISSFGKLYLNKKKLLDSGFSIWYLAINIGSFFGVLFIGYSGEKFGYQIGFIISGILMLFSLIPILVSKEKLIPDFKTNEVSIGKRFLIISSALLIIGLFWGLYEISSIRIYVLQSNFSEILSTVFPKSILQSLNSIFIFPISLIAIILWTYFYSSQYFKLMLGFGFGAVSLGILSFVPTDLTEQHIFIYLLAIFFLNISEIHIAPLVHSVLTQFSNPKYLSILISLSFIPSRLISISLGLTNDNDIFYENPYLGLIMGLSVMTIICFCLFVFRKKINIYNNF